VYDYEDDCVDDCDYDDDYGHDCDVHAGLAGFGWKVY
jgi:hypothetical protein